LLNLTKPFPQERESFVQEILFRILGFDEYNVFFGKDFDSEFAKNLISKKYIDKKV